MASKFSSGCAVQAGEGERNKKKKGKTSVKLFVFFVRQRTESVEGLAFFRFFFAVCIPLVCIPLVCIPHHLPSCLPLSASLFLHLNPSSSLVLPLPASILFPLICIPLSASLVLALSASLVLPLSASLVLPLSASLVLPLSASLVLPLSASLVLPLSTSIHLLSVCIPRLSSFSEHPYFFLNPSSSIVCVHPCSSVFIRVHLRSSVFICVHLCSSLWIFLPSSVFICAHPSAPSAPSLSASVSFPTATRPPSLCSPLLFSARFYILFFPLPLLSVVVLSLSLVSCLLLVFFTPLVPPLYCAPVVNPSLSVFLPTAELLVVV